MRIAHPIYRLNNSSRSCRYSQWKLVHQRQGLKAFKDQLPFASHTELQFLTDRRNFCMPNFTVSERKIKMATRILTVSQPQFVIEMMPLNNLLRKWGVKIFQNRWKRFIPICTWMICVLSKKEKRTGDTDMKNEIYTQDIGMEFGIKIF